MSTKETWSSRIRHDDNATYQGWRDEMITKLALLTYLTADETNITPGAGARPGTSTEGGYAVYHLNDSLHGTAPVYIRFGFGTAAGATTPAFRVTFGTATNGSGVLSGTALTTITTISGNAAACTTDTARASYLSCHPGFLGLSWKQASPADGFMFINRSCDSTGAITATGAHTWVGNFMTGGSGAQRSQSLRYASTAAAYTARTSVSDGMLGFNPQAPTSTLVGSDIQVAVGWFITPQVAPLFGVCGVLPAEVTANSTFTTTLVGTTSRTYIGLPSDSGAFGPALVSGAAGLFLRFAMLWE